jgi:hypothetical protein
MNHDDIVRDSTEQQSSGKNINPNPLSCLTDHAKSNSLQNVKQDLCTKGWSFLYNDIPERFSYDSNGLREPFINFQVYINSHETVKKSTRHVKYPENRFGYFKTSRKEGYRFMTGTRLTEFSMPPQLDIWRKVAQQCDELSKLIVRNHAAYLFGLSNSLEEASNLPLLVPHRVEGSFGLFDIVYYHPQDKFPERFKDTESQVDEHADPGLFSISLGSTAPGLEMFDPSDNTWVAVPNDAVVLWCGHAVTKVSKGTVKPGVHRVKATPNERMTAWHEVCTLEQIPPRVMIPQEIQLELQLRLQEEEEGISMSKSGMRRQDPTFGYMGLDGYDIKTLKKQMHQQPYQENKLAYFNPVNHEPHGNQIKNKPCVIM